MGDHPGFAIPSLPGLIIESNYHREILPREQTSEKGVEIYIIQSAEVILYWGIASEQYLC